MYQVVISAVQILKVGSCGGEWLVWSGKIFLRRWHLNLDLSDNSWPCGNLGERALQAGEISNTKLSKVKMSLLYKEQSEILFYGRFARKTGEFKFYSEWIGKPLEDFKSLCCDLVYISKGSIWLLHKDVESHL